jgi:small-conductance mechanosensitive channel
MRMTAKTTLSQKTEVVADLSWAWVESHSGDILLAAGAGLAMVGALYLLRLAGERAATHKGRWYSVLGRALASMRVWFMLAVALYLISQAGEAPAQITSAARLIFIIAATLQAAFFFRELIIGSIQMRADDDDPGGSLSTAIGLIRALVTAALFIVAAILILSNIGVNVTGLVAGLGIGGIAIGLAAQGIFADLFAALAMLFDKPFRRGDVIAWETFTGTVEYIGLKSTRIRALTGEEIIVSNTNLLSKVVRNNSRVHTRKVVLTLSLIYQTPRTLSDALPQLLRETINGVEGCTYLRCGLDAFAPSSLDYRLVYALDGEDPEELLTTRHTVNHAILRLFAEKGIQFAYPASISYTAAPDGRLIMPYPEESPSG